MPKHCRGVNYTKGPTLSIFHHSQAVLTLWAISSFITGLILYTKGEVIGISNRVIHSHKAGVLFNISPSQKRETHVSCPYCLSLRVGSMWRESFHPAEVINGLAIAITLMIKKGRRNKINDFSVNHVKFTMCFMFCMLYGCHLERLLFTYIISFFFYLFFCQITNNLQPNFPSYLVYNMLFKHKTQQRCLCHIKSPY